MNKEFSYDFLDKILKYALRNKEHGIREKRIFSLWNVLQANGDMQSRSTRPF